MREPVHAGHAGQGWWRLCPGHAFWPLLGVLLLFAAPGGVAHEIAPHADSLMGVLQTLGDTWPCLD